jgi:hypothetical protein
MLLPGIANSQTQERFISKVSWRTEPVEIIGLRNERGVLELGKKFLDEEDWLKGLTVTAKNNSNKSISRIEIDLAFPRPRGTSEEISTLVVPMVYGQEPSDASGTNVQKEVSVGESVDVKLLEANLPAISKALQSLGYAQNISHVQISLDSVTFTDESTWAGDDILYRDPTNPKQKINPKLHRTTLEGPCGPSELRFQKANFNPISPASIFTAWKTPLSN